MFYRVFKALLSFKKSFRNEALWNTEEIICFSNPNLFLYTKKYKVLKEEYQKRKTVIKNIVIEKYNLEYNDAFMNSL